MKRFTFLFVIIMASVCVFSQENAKPTNTTDIVASADSTKTPPKSSITSIISQKSEPLTDIKVDRLEYRLTKFHDAQMTSFVFMGAGMVMNIVGSFLNAESLMSSSTPKPGNSLLILGGSACMITGLVVNIDSYKFLNFHNRKRKEVNAYDYY